MPPFECYRSVLSEAGYQFSDDGESVLYIPDIYSSSNSDLSEDDPAEYGVEPDDPDSAQQDQHVMQQEQPLDNTELQDDWSDDWPQKQPLDDKDFQDDWPDDWPQADQSEPDAWGYYPADYATPVQGVSNNNSRVKEDYPPDPGQFCDAETDIEEQSVLTQYNERRVPTSLDEQLNHLSINDGASHSNTPSQDIDVPHLSLPYEKHAPSYMKARPVGTPVVESVAEEGQFSDASDDDSCSIPGDCVQCMQEIEKCGLEQTEPDWV